MEIGVLQEVSVKMEMEMDDVNHLPPLVSFGLVPTANFPSAHLNYRYRIGPKISRPFEQLHALSNLEFDPSLVIILSLS